MVNHNDLPPMLDIDDVLISMDCITELFCCDIDTCHGVCCIEGDAGAPLTIDEILEIEDSLDCVWKMIPAQAQAIIDKDGVCTIDITGEFVTNIVNGRDCIFAYYSNGNCLCSFDSKFRTGECAFPKPISCALYPIREKKMRNGMIALNYDRWNICKCGIENGKKLGIPLYKFLQKPLTRRFGMAWFDKLELTIEEMRQQGLLHSAIDNH